MELKKPIRYEITKEPIRMQKMHFHDFLEIYYQMQGEKEYFINDKSYHLIEGDIIFIGEKIIHKAFSSDIEKSERALIQMKRSYIKESIHGYAIDFLFKIFDDQIFIIRMKEQHQQKLARLIQNIGEEYRKSTEDKNLDFIVLTKVIELLYFIYEYYENEENLTNNSSVEEYGYIPQINKYLNDNFSNKINLDDISKLIGINKFYICKLYKKATGFTIMEYINLLRIKTACKLLQHTNKNITTISEDVGYSDISYFGKTFKQHIGISPLKFRKEYKGDILV